MNQKNLLLVSTLVTSLVLLFVLSSHSSKPVAQKGVDEVYLNLHAQKDWNSCISKAGSSWGGKCLSYGFSEDMYNIDLVNNCTDKLDLMCCVQRMNGQWRCFYRLDMNPNDTLSAYACKGTGKYLKWVRKAGDVQVKFPSVDEVNDQY